MNVLLITSVYPNIEPNTSSTPVVHYFAREWVKLGHNVRVISCPSNFPWYLRYPANIFKKLISSKTGGDIRTVNLQEKVYVIDDVNVYRIPMFKWWPHIRYSKTLVNEVSKKILNFCSENMFLPDVIIGHWVNPQLELINILKSAWNNPITCLVMHDCGVDLDNIYRKEHSQLLNNIDVIGYRSDAIKRGFEKKYGVWDKWFYCYSGVPESFISPIVKHRTFDNVTSFTFVGTLIQRKFPVAILKALMHSKLSSNFRLRYIGSGYEAKKIKQIVNENVLLKEQVVLSGYIPREDIVTHLLNTDVFVMISANETFGLVYLEAMSVGCITIASRNEGFDGIIKDGVNGFLCEAGNVNELQTIIDRIVEMTPEELQRISNNAIQTAQNMTDKIVAKQYIMNLENLINK